MTATLGERGSLALALVAAVPGQVLVVAVAVVLAVGLVVLALVTGEIGQREAVMGREEVDAARARLAREGVEGAGEPRRQPPDHSAITTPERRKSSRARSFHSRKGAGKLPSW